MQGGGGYSCDGVLAALGVARVAARGRHSLSVEKDRT